MLSTQRPSARDHSLSVCCRALPGTSLASIAPHTLTERLSKLGNEFAGLKLAALAFDHVEASNVASCALSHGLFGLNRATCRDLFRTEICVRCVAVKNHLIFSIQIPMDLPTEKKHSHRGRAFPIRVKTGSDNHTMRKRRRRYSCAVEYLHLDIGSFTASSPGRSSTKIIRGLHTRRSFSVPRGAPSTDSGHAHEPFPILGDKKKIWSKRPVLAPPRSAGPPSVFIGQRSLGLSFGKADVRHRERGWPRAHSIASAQ